MKNSTMTDAVDLSQVDLNLLYTFRTVVIAGGVGAAARTLGRTQPAISSRLRILEAQLGARLFERVGRGIGLSPIGRRLSEEAESLFFKVQGVLDTVRAAGEKPLGTLRIGALPTVGVHLIAPQIARFQKMHPETKVEMKMGLTQGHLSGLKEGSLDLVASVGPLADPSLQAIEIGVARPTCVMPPNHELAQKPKIRIRDLQGQPFIDFGKVGDLFFDAIADQISKAGVKLDVRVEVTHIQSIQMLVAHGAGLGILPSYTVYESGLVQRTLVDMDFTQPIWIATRPGAMAIPLVAAFLEDFIGETIPSQPLTA